MDGWKPNKPAADVDLPSVETDLAGTGTRTRTPSTETTTQQRPFRIYQSYTDIIHS